MEQNHCIRLVNHTDEFVIQVFTGETLAYVMHEASDVAKQYSAEHPSAVLTIQHKVFVTGDDGSLSSISSSFWADSKVEIAEQEQVTHE